jgi:hypothetical protein
MLCLQCRVDFYSWTDRMAFTHAIGGYLVSVGSGVGVAWLFPIIVHGAARGY